MAGEITAERVAELVQIAEAANLRPMRTMPGDITARAEAFDCTFDPPTVLVILAELKASREKADGMRSGLKAAADALREVHEGHGCQPGYISTLMLRRVKIAEEAALSRAQGADR